MPDTNLPTTHRIHPVIVIVLIVFILLYLGLNAWIYFYGTNVFNFSLNLKNATQTVSVVKEQGFTKVLEATPPPPHRPPPSEIPSGTQVYAFSYGDAVTGPHIQEATIDPQTPPPGTKQTVTLTVKNASPVTGVSATLFTDTQQHTYSFVLVKGTKTDGTWQGFWTVRDTYDYTYYLKFHLTSSTGTYDGGIKFRD